MLRFALAMCLLVSLCGANWYVDSTAGNDANAGTVGSPWKSLDAALKSASPSNGDTVILVRAAHVEDSAGADDIEPTSDKALTIQPASGTCSFSFAAAVTNGINTDFASNASLTFTDINFDFRVSGTSPSGYCLKLGGATVATDVTFTNCGIGTSSETATLVLVQAGAAVTEDFTFTDCSFAQSAAATTGTILLNGHFGIFTITGGTVSAGTGHNVSVGGDVGYIRITGVTSWDSRNTLAGTNSMLYNSATSNDIDGLTIANCAVLHRGSHALLLVNGGCVPIFTGNTITCDATVTAGVGLGCGTDGHTATAPAIPAFVITDNTVTQAGTVQSHAVMLGKGPTGGLFAYNKVTGGDYALVVKCDGATIAHNAIAKTADMTADGGIYIRGGQRNAFINNSVYCSHGACVLSDTQASGPQPPLNNIFYGNIFKQASGNAAELLHDETTADGNMDTFVFDMNIYDDGSGNMLSLNNGGSAVTFAALSNMTAAGGWATYAPAYYRNDVNSVETNPRFIGAAAGDLRINRASPARPLSGRMWNALGAWGVQPSSGAGGGLEFK